MFRISVVRDRYAEFTQSRVARSEKKKAENSFTHSVNVENLYFSYGEEPVIKGLDLKVRKGEQIAIVGPSGSGKSTLLHVIAGLLKADSGLLEIEGRAVRGPSPRYNLMFQNPSLFPWHNVEKNLRLALDLSGRKSRGHEADEAVQHVLELVELEDYARAGVQSLSGGQKQRVSLARSLITRPSVLLLDEPFSALDPLIRKQLQHKVREIAAAEGVTLLLVTHDLEEAATIGERILFFDRDSGQIRHEEHSDNISEHGSLHAGQKLLEKFNHINSTEFSGQRESGQRTGFTSSADMAGRV